MGIRHRKQPGPILGVDDVPVIGTPSQPEPRIGGGDRVRQEAYMYNYW